MKSALALTLALASLASAASVGAAPVDAPLSRFPESASIRSAYWDSFFLASEPELLHRPPATVQGERSTFKLFAVKSGGYLYAIANATRGPGDAKSEPILYSQGSWILKRSSPDGAPLQAKVFLRSDPGTFIRIYPDGDRSKLDLVVYGAVLNREVPLPLPFEAAALCTMAEIADMTKSLVDWGLFSPEIGMYREVRAFVAETRRRLPALRYADDGALGADGAPVYIATGKPQVQPTGLNCSGFAAWVADGFYKPLTGVLLDPRALASRHVEARPTGAADRYETELDPFFGLDWTRNIAKALLDARYPSRSHGLSESDVRISPFALVSPTGAIDPAGVNGSSSYRDYPAYQLDLGYEVSGLKGLLYVLALREPGSIYLGSIARKSGGAIPGLSRHYHVAVLAPYFAEDGRFEVAVFESDVETSVDAIMRRVPKDYIHLVRIKAERDYDPPPFPAR
jgi:hypothetical protein